MSMYPKGRAGGREGGAVNDRAVFSSIRYSPEMSLCERHRI